MSVFPACRRHVAFKYLCVCHVAEHTQSTVFSLFSHIVFFFYFKLTNVLFLLFWTSGLKERMFVYHENHTAPGVGPVWNPYNLISDGTMLPKLYLIKYLFNYLSIRLPFLWGSMLPLFLNIHCSLYPCFLYVFEYTGMFSIFCLHVSMASHTEGQTS